MIRYIFPIYLFYTSIPFFSSFYGNIHILLTKNVNPKNYHKKIQPKKYENHRILAILISLHKLFNFYNSVSVKLTALRNASVSSELNSI